MTDLYFGLGGQLAQVRDGQGRIVGFEYDELSQLTELRGPGGERYRYQYGDNGDLTGIRDALNLETSFAYEANFSQLASFADARDNGIQYEYDDRGNLTAIIYADDSQESFTYDALGNVLTNTNRRAQTISYSYNSSGLLTTKDYNTTPGVDFTYDYDEAGNRRQVIDDGVVTEYVTNEMNQYDTVGGTTYEYDIDGNLISKTEGGVTTTYTYDIENRLVEVATGTDTWTYAYDAFGNRIETVHDGETTQYVIDPTGLGNVAAEYDGGKNLIAAYEHGLGLLSRTDDTGAGAFYTFSAIGSTSELTDSVGVTLNAYHYDPFGVSMDTTESTRNPFKYIGEYGVMNEGNGLVHMRARYFVSGIGHFTQEDPTGISGGLNLNAYANQNPVSFSDPTGNNPVFLQQLSYRISQFQPQFIGRPGWGAIGKWVPSAFWDVFRTIYFLYDTTYGEFARKIYEYVMLPPPPNNPDLIPPTPPYFDELFRRSGIPRSHDLNDKLAPAGFGDVAFIHPRIARGRHQQGVAVGGVSLRWSISQRGACCVVAPWMAGTRVLKTWS